jgi:RNA polymerase sigma-70 factor (ECF subfamily)
MHTGLTDTDIIALVLKGDQQAYAIVVERYRNFVFTIVLRYLKSREDAEETAQDIFVKAYRHLADFKGQSKFSTWLYTVATTTCISFLRKKKPEVHSLDHEKMSGFAENLDGGMSANGIEQKSRVNMVQQSIALLRPEDAQVLTLFYKGEQSLEEVARIVRKEPNAVKVQLHRARSRLKQKMQEHFREEIKDL